MQKAGFPMGRLICNNYLDVFHIPQMTEFRADLERRKQEMSVNFDKEVTRHVVLSACIAYILYLNGITYKFES